MFHFQLHSKVNTAIMHIGTSKSPMLSKIINTATALAVIPPFYATARISHGIFFESKQYHYELQSNIIKKSTNLKIFKWGSNRNIFEVKIGSFKCTLLSAIVCIHQESDRSTAANGGGI